MDRKELTEQLGRLVHESRALIDAADKRDADLVAQGKEARGFGAEEEQKYQRINDEITNVEGQIAAIDRRETQERREKFLQEREKEPVLRSSPTDHRAASPATDGEKPLETAEYRNVFRKYLTGGVQALNPFEARALSMGQDPEGGFTVPQEQFVRELIKTLDDMIDKQAVITKDPEARKKILLDIQRFLIDQAYLFTLVSPASFSVAQGYVKELYPLSIVSDEYMHFEYAWMDK